MYFALRYVNRIFYIMYHFLWDPTVWDNTRYVFVVVVVVVCMIFYGIHSYVRKTS